MCLEETGLLMVVDSTRCRVKGLAVNFEITVEPDPLDERAKRIRRVDVDRIRSYLRTGK